MLYIMVFIMAYRNQDHLERVPSFSAFLRLFLKRKMPIGTVISADMNNLYKSPTTKGFVIVAPDSRAILAAS